MNSSLCYRRDVRVLNHCIVFHKAYELEEAQGCSNALMARVTLEGATFLTLVHAFGLTVVDVVTAIITVRFDFMN